MDNHEQHIDQAFQRRLRDASVPPPAFVWPAVEKELRKRKRKLLVWWWTGGSAVLLAAASWYWMNHRAVDEAVALPATPNQEILRPSTTIASESSMTSAALPNNQATNEQPAFHGSYIADTRIKQDRTGNARKLSGHVVEKSAGTIPVVSSPLLTLSENHTVSVPAATTQAANITRNIRRKL